MYNNENEKGHLMFGYSGCLSIYDVATRRTFNIPEKPDVRESYWLSIVQKSGLDLKFVPEEYKTPEICLAAVEQNEDAQEFVKWTPEVEKAFVEAGWEFEDEQPNKAVGLSIKEMTESAKSKADTHNAGIENKSVSHEGPQL